jgi:hypothetical protein
MWSRLPCSFVTCPNRRTPRPIEPGMKSEDSSRSLPCSRPRVLPQGDAGSSQSSLRSPPDKRERPRSVPSVPNGTRQLLSVSASSTTVNLEMPVTTSLSAGGANMVTVQLEATTSTEAGATTARRIGALHPSHRALRSLARPIAKHYSWLGSDPPRLLPSIMAKPNPNFGSLTSAWLVSWVGEGSRWRTRGGE